MLHAAGPINSMLENLGLISEPLPFLTDALCSQDHGHCGKYVGRYPVHDHDRDKRAD